MEDKREKKTTQSSKAERKVELVSCILFAEQTGKENRVQGNKREQEKEKDKTKIEVLLPPCCAHWLLVSYTPLSHPPSHQSLV